MNLSPTWYTARTPIEARLNDQAIERRAKARLRASRICTATVERQGV